MWFLFSKKKISDIFVGFFVTFFLCISRPLIIPPHQWFDKSTWKNWHMGHFGPAWWTTVDRWLSRLRTYSCESRWDRWTRIFTSEEFDYWVSLGPDRLFTTGKSTHWLFSVCLKCFDTEQELWLRDVVKIIILMPYPVSGKGNLWIIFP